MDLAQQILVTIRKIASQYYDQFIDDGTGWEKQMLVDMAHEVSAMVGQVQDHTKCPRCQGNPVKIGPAYGGYRILVCGECNAGWLLRMEVPHVASDSVVLALGEGEAKGSRDQTAGSTAIFTHPESWR